jgi:hypothetical protein
MIRQLMRDHSKDVEGSRGELSWTNSIYYHNKCFGGTKEIKKKTSVITVSDPVDIRIGFYCLHLQASM